MFDLKISMTIMAKKGSNGHYGHGHFQAKHDNDWYMTARKFVSSKWLVLQMVDQLRKE